MNCNILLLGQTGVGKSSLLNYLAGEIIAEAGVSSTAGGITRGIHKYQLTINDQKCLVSDSEGLELSHSDYWLDLIDSELFKDTKQAKISDWYHIVVYCIGSNGGRVQDFELEILDKIMEAGYGVIIAFTKADLATEDELSLLQKAIDEHFEHSPAIQYIPICSKKTRYSQLEGRQALCDAIIDSWGESISNRLPSYIYDFTFGSLSSWYDVTYNWLSSQKIGLFNRSKNEVLDQLNRKIQGKQGSLNHCVELKQKSAFQEVSEVYSALSRVIDVDSLSVADSSLTPKIEKLQGAFVFDDNTFGKSIRTVASTVLLFSVPIVGVPLTILNTVLGFKDSDKRTAELLSAFNHQYLSLTKIYIERKKFLSYLLADEIGYIDAHLELAICYLKGRGVKEDYSKFCEYIGPLADYITDEENGYRNGRAEYYIAYMYYSFNDNNEGKRWIKMAKEDEYPNAIKVYKYSDTFSEMKALEASADKEYLSSFYDIDS